jgi:hypothetical protein
LFPAGILQYDRVCAGRRGALGGGVAEPGWEALISNPYLSIPMKMSDLWNCISYTETINIFTMPNGKMQVKICFFIKVYLMQVVLRSK